MTNDEWMAAQPVGRVDAMRYADANGNGWRGAPEPFTFALDGEGAELYAAVEQMAPFQLAKRHEHHELVCGSLACFELEEDDGERETVWVVDELRQDYHEGRRVVLVTVIPLFRWQVL